jgi:hypothetical protein
MRYIAVQILLSFPSNPSHNVEGSISTHLILLMIISSREEENSSVAMGADFEALREGEGEGKRRVESGEQRRKVVSWAAIETQMPYSRSVKTYFQSECLR